MGGGAAHRACQRGWGGRRPPCTPSAVHRRWAADGKEEAGGVNGKERGAVGGERRRRLGLAGAPAGGVAQEQRRRARRCPNAHSRDMRLRWGPSGPAHRAPTRGIPLSGGLPVSARLSTPAIRRRHWRRGYPRTQLPSLQVRHVVRSFSARMPVGGEWHGGGGAGEGDEKNKKTIEKKGRRRRGCPPSPPPQPYHLSQCATASRP